MSKEQFKREAIAILHALLMVCVLALFMGWVSRFLGIES